MPVFVEDRPSEALVLEGLDPRTLGLFHGIAMPDQSVLGPGPDAGLIHLFQRNLEREGRGQDDLAEQIRITVLHETAHYFGADEQRHAPLRPELTLTAAAAGLPIAPAAAAGPALGRRR